MILTIKACLVCIFAPSIIPSLYYIVLLLQILVAVLNSIIINNWRNFCIGFVHDCSERMCDSLYFQLEVSIHVEFELASTDACCDT